MKRAMLLDILLFLLIFALVLCAIEYFEETEEYEKCQTLVKLKNSKTLIKDLNKRLKTSEDDT